MSYIPFIISATSLQLVKSVYTDAERIHVPLDIATKLSTPPAMKVWINPMVDGLDNIDARRPRPDSNDAGKTIQTEWYTLMNALSGFEKFADPSFIEKPEQKIVNKFVGELLDLCLEHNPSWISVPQLPAIEGSGRNRINKALSGATASWRERSEFSGKLILPLIFTHQNQFNSKTIRNKKIDQAKRNYHDSQADGVWVVDESFSDESGSKTLRGDRLTLLIKLHQELNEAISTRLRIGGPYWGFNLVLWARRLIEFPAIGVGSSYQYRLSGTKPVSPAASRVAISSLRRRVVAGKIRPWLEKTLKGMSTSNAGYSELDQLLKRLNFLNEYSHAREQVARFYKTWLDVLSATPPAGRSLALFQDLATAYAIGKTMSVIPDEGPARRPESIVEPMMINSLADAS